MPDAHSLDWRQALASGQALDAAGGRRSGHGLMGRSGCDGHRGRARLGWGARGGGAADQEHDRDHQLRRCHTNRHRLIVHCAAMGNSFGTLFRITTFGESHGPGLGVVVDGCPAAAPARSRADPGASSIAGGPARAGWSASARRPIRSRSCRACSTASTLGTPIAMLIRNTDARSKDYAEHRPRVSARAMPTTPTTRSTASARSPAAAARARARPRAALRPVRSRSSCSRRAASRSSRGSRRSPASAPDSTMQASPAPRSTPTTSAVPILRPPCR